MHEMFLSCSPHDQHIARIQRDGASFTIAYLLILQARKGFAARASYHRGVTEYAWCVSCDTEYHGVVRQQRVFIRVPMNEPLIIFLIQVVRVDDNIVEWVTTTDPVARSVEPLQGLLWVW